MISFSKESRKWIDWLNTQITNDKQAFILKSSLTVCWILAAVVFATIIYTIPRGFDLSDESFYWMGYKTPDQFVYIGFFQWLGEVFIIEGHHEIKILRGIRLLLHLISSFFLYASVNYFFQRTGHIKPELRLLLPLLLLGNFASYSIGPQSLSYNHMVLILLQIEAGIIFFLLGNKNERTPLFLCWLGLAIAHPLLFLAKFPTAFIFLFFWPILLLLYPQKTSWKKAFLCFLCLSIPIFFLARSPTNINNFISDYQAYSRTMTSHNPLNLLFQLWNTSQQFFIEIIKNNLKIDRLILLLFLVYLKFPRTRIGLILAITWLFLSFDNYFNLFKQHGFFPSQSLWIDLIIVGLFFQAYISIKEALFILAIVLIPFGASIGTNNNIFTHITFYLPFIILSAFLFKNHVAQSFGNLSVVLATGIICYSFLMVYWEHPYRLNTSYSQQNTPFNIAHSGEQILMDSETAQGLNQLKLLLKKNNIKPTNHYLCSYSGMIGAGLLLGYNAPVHSWNDDKEMEYNKYCWSKKSLKKDKPFIWLSISETETHPNFLNKTDCLGELLGTVDLIVYQKKQKVFAYRVHWL
jgi:hypothetical protein